jgi:hypothetical protein
MRSCAALRSFSGADATWKLCLLLCCLQLDVSGDTSENAECVVPWTCVAVNANCSGLLTFVDPGGANLLGGKGITCPLWAIIVQILVWCNIIFLEASLALMPLAYSLASFDSIIAEMTGCRYWLVVLDDLGLSGLIDCIFVINDKLEGLVCNYCTVLSFVSDVLDILDFELSDFKKACLSCILATFNALVEREFTSGSFCPISGCFVVNP